MEILQTIWTALTTENEVLSNIFLVPFMYLEVFLTMLLFTTLLNIPSNFKQKSIYVILLGTIGVLTNFFVPKPYNTFINVISCPIIVMIVFKTTLFKSILAEILPYIIFVLVETLLQYIYMLIFNVTTNDIIVIPIHRIFSSIISYSTVLLIYLVIKYFKINIYLLDNMRNYINSMLILNFGVGILAIAVQSYVTAIYSNILPLNIVVLSLVTLLCYFIFSLYGLARTNKLEITRRDLEQSKQYINTLTILHDSIRCFKHDFNNIVTTIRWLHTVK